MIASPKVDQVYGKNFIRFLKIIRPKNDIPTKSWHEIHEFKVKNMIRGDFDAVYDGDNSLCVPTDTCKNNAVIVGRTTDFDSPEEYALNLATQMLQRYGHVNQSEVDVERVVWKRIMVKGRESTHGFHKDSVSASCRLVMKKTSGGFQITELTSSLSNLTVLKTVGSHFTHYHLCDRTTLKPARHRVLSTRFLITWHWNLKANEIKGHPFTKRFEQIREKTLTTLVEHVNSLSLQETQKLIGNEVFKLDSKISKCRILAPNVHYVDMNWEKYGMSKTRDMVMPISEPSGWLDATFSRKQSTSTSWSRF